MLDYFYFYAYVSFFLLNENYYLGFYHEQSRPDRDNYVDVYFDNIDPQDKAHNFNKCSDCTTQNEPYDFDSIMHYSKTAFGNGKVTLARKGCPSCKLGQNNGFSPLDIKGLNDLYGCSKDNINTSTNYRWIRRNYA